jgi:hypothetical protein
MAMDSILILASLVSFAALVIIWVAAPLHAEEPTPDTVAEPAGHTAIAA